jgi:hypothetical protein
MGTGFGHTFKRLSLYRDSWPVFMSPSYVKMNMQYQFIFRSNECLKHGFSLCYGHIMSGDFRVLNHSVTVLCRIIMLSPNYPELQPETCNIPYSVCWIS